jgi:hypothetical protein
MPACPAGRELAMIIILLCAKIFTMARFICVGLYKLLTIFLVKSEIKFCAAKMQNRSFIFPEILFKNK